MSRFIGGKYGAGNIPIDNDGQTAPSSVYSSSDQFWMSARPESNWWQDVLTISSTSPTQATATPGNGYTYMKFTGPGSVTVAGSGTLDILVVAGGGGGGQYYGAGGGGGGVAYGVAIPFATPPTGTVYPVEVGTGGQGAPHPGATKIGAPGNVSNFGSPGSPIGGQPDRIQAKGGGGAGAGTADLGLAGGSGGGDGGGNSPPIGGPATQPGTNPSPLITDYGYPGGWAYPSGGYAPSGGGGGGAQGANVPGNDQGGGNGGVGAQIPLFPYPLVGLSPLAPNSPTTNHYAGGGGGGKYSVWTSPDRTGTGGYGGGGWGHPNPTPMAGIDQLGGGGGGRHPGATGGSGGNGVVIIRAKV